MPMTINGGNFSALQQDFDRMAQTAEPSRVQGALEEAAQPILDRMKQNASSNPHPRSGTLRASLNTGKGKGGSVTIGAHRKDWDDGEYYAPYVEFGHGGPRPAPPHPFARPAADAGADEAMNILADRIARELK